jgi:1-acyl-sn-glycerol-3-phosphate acyltransferase
MRIGEPIPAPASRRKPDLEAATLELQRRINALLDQG